MKKSKYLILSGLYFDFNDDLSEITNVKELFENQNIIDLFRFNNIKSITEYKFNGYNINFVYLPKNIEKIENEAFYKNQIQILDLSNCINLNIIMGWAFESNQIKQLKLPQNINLINVEAFSFNKIKILDLSNCTQLKYIDENAFLNNPLNEIKILEEVEIEFNIDYKNDVWKKFIKYYHNHVEKAGDYKLENNEWQWYPL